MPTYDYQCRSCGHTFEVIHPMHEDGPTVCERCGGELRRVLYPTGIIFKGSGFYKTDSRSASSAAVSGSSTRPASAGESGGGTSSTPGSSAGGDGTSKKKAPKADA